MSLHDLADEVAELGNELAAAYRRLDANDADLPALAAEVLAGISTTVSFDPAEAVELFLTTSVEQQPKVLFSDLPLMMFRGPDFYIELLVWAQASTAIHEHGFAGAFRVMSGSSLHTTYRFEANDVIGPELHLGSVVAEVTEYLPTGSVRQIVPGAEGLVHSLYHLDEPSLSVVVRTYGSERHAPQRTYYRPHVAMNLFHFDRDALSTLLRRTLRVAQQVDPSRIRSIWLDQLVQLDFGRFAYLYLGNGASLSDADRAEVIQAAELRHGARARLVAETADASQRLQHLANQRSMASEPEIRFLVACLMNAPDRAAVLGLIRSYRPDRDPVELCAEWLAHLSQGKVKAEQLFTQFAARAEIETLRLGRRLANALPPEQQDPDGAAAAFRAYLGGEVSPDDAGAQAAFTAAVNEIDELASLR